MTVKIGARIRVARCCTEDGTENMYDPSPVIQQTREACVKPGFKLFRVCNAIFAPTAAPPPYPNELAPDVAKRDASSTPM